MSGQPERQGRRDFDFVVIGGGSGGVRAARIAGRHGARVALVEADRLGGTCVHRGCVPKKLMVYAARFRDHFEDSVGFGWTPGEARFDWATMLANVRREVERNAAAYKRGLDNAGVIQIADRAVLDGPDAVRLQGSGEVLGARHILVATGGRPNTIDVPGGELAITSDGLFLLPALPRSILIVGGGYIAVEFAAVLAALGSTVTILHRGREILRPFDHDMRRRMQESLAGRGVRFVGGDELAAIERAGDGLRATIRAGARIDAEHVLLAIGRTPNTGGLGLSEAGVELDGGGAIMVDRKSRTTAPNIFAVGDVTNRVNLTPVAIREGHAVADNLFAGGDVAVDHADVPHAVFGTPEIGAVGLTEEMAREQHPSLDIYRSEFTPMRNQVAGRAEKMVIKLLVEGESQRLVGCHIFGPEAAELIQLVAVAIKLRATKAELDSVMALHPTSAEEIVTMREPSERVRPAADA